MIAVTQSLTSQTVALYVMTHGCMSDALGASDRARLIQNVRYVNHLARHVDQVLVSRIVPPALAAAVSNDFLVSLLAPNARNVVTHATDLCGDSVRADTATPPEVGILVARALSDRYEMLKALATALAPMQKLLVATDTCTLVRTLGAVVRGIHGYTDTGPLWSLGSRISGDTEVFYDDFWVVTGPPVISQVLNCARRFCSEAAAPQAGDFAHSVVSYLRVRGIPFTRANVTYAADDLIDQRQRQRSSLTSAVISVSDMRSDPLRFLWDSLLLAACPLLARRRADRDDPAARTFLKQVVADSMDLPTAVLDTVLEAS